MITKKKSKWWSATDIRKIKAIMKIAEEEGLGRFYRILGITVAANTKHNEDNTDLKTCYNADVVYGTLLYFIGDHLRDIYRNVKNGRGFDLLVVDEVDSTFIDQTGMKVQKELRCPSGSPIF